MPLVHRLTDAPDDIFTSRGGVIESQVPWFVASSNFLYRIALPADPITPTVSIISWGPGLERAAAAIDVSLRTRLRVIIITYVSSQTHSFQVYTATRCSLIVFRDIFKVKAHATSGE